ncbi:hypothetical protein BJ508DRAFT_71125 [Ascobolus immersus RN42]|uniref:Uncharacterized protein n=1 Tax=Ascobolus immersus RN42 TaxID=1160509 RepID=A0A3N4IB76_ASCIM|nr:hypothetical protein BJ508DRAFT_71125 [Ascobolus immersus RN42]
MVLEPLLPSCRSRISQAHPCVCKNTLRSIQQDPDRILPTDKVAFFKKSRSLRILPVETSRVSHFRARISTCCLMSAVCTTIMHGGAPIASFRVDLPLSHFIHVDEMYLEPRKQPLYKNNHRRPMPRCCVCIPPHLETLLQPGRQRAALTDGARQMSM